MGIFWKKRRRCGVVGFFVWAIAGMTALQAQNWRLDALKSELAAAKTDTAKVRILSGIAMIYTDVDLDSAFRYCERAEDLAAETNHP
jgi:hypothetical protein